MGDRASQHRLSQPQQYGSTVAAGAHDEIAAASGYQLHKSPRSGGRGRSNSGGVGMNDPAELDGLFRDDTLNEDGEDDYDDDESLGDDSDRGMSLEELLYSSSSYNAIVKPVTLTMILAALTVVFINTEQSLQEGEAMMAQAYQVWKTSDNTPSGTALVLSLGNSLVLVTAICAITFVVVLLYRFRCMNLLIGYMVLASATLLGILGGNIFQVAIEKYHIPIDKVSFYLIVYNFCVVGVIAVFWQRGVPKYITQGYLICTAVILAWQLTHFDEWTTWSLLFMLALYDLCAVLTPCGPLRVLVNLMSQDDSPSMPGLLYEAELPAGTRRPGGPSRDRESNGIRPPARPSQHGSQDNGTADNSAGVNQAPSTSQEGEGPTVDIPLALARVYNLTVIGIPRRGSRTLSLRRKRSPQVSNAPLLDNQTNESQRLEIPESPSPAQLCSYVTVRLPLHGGRIETLKRRGRKMFLERDRFGNAKRYIWVDRDGKVFAERHDDNDDDDDSEGDENGGNSIKLGLGDFIFYSVLVGKAAQHSFATFAACMLVVLAGLGGTLVLLSVYHHALPALPISIFLGVFFYIFTRLLMEPWIESVLTRPMYV